MPAAASARATPRCAKPRAPPPASTRPTARRACSRASRAISRSCPARTCTTSASGRRASQRAVPTGATASAGCSSTRISAASARPGRPCSNACSVGCSATGAFASASSRISSAWRTQASVQGVGAVSAASSTKSCSASASSRRAPMRCGELASGSRPAVSAPSVTVLPCSASRSASACAKPAASMPAVIGTRAIVAGRSPGADRRSLRSRSMICRVMARDSAGLDVCKPSKPAGSRRASTEWRTATTVAERGSPVIRLISPISWPRPMSRTARSVPSPSRT